VPYKYSYLLTYLLVVATAAAGVVVVRSLGFISRLAHWWDWEYFSAVTENTAFYNNSNALFHFAAKAGLCVYLCMISVINK